MTKVGIIVDGPRPAVEWVSLLPRKWVTRDERLVLYALACDAFSEESAPGLDNLALWTGMFRSSVAEILTRLCEPTDKRPALIERAETTRGGRRTTFRLFIHNRPARPDGSDIHNRPANSPVSPDGNRPADRPAPPDTPLPHGHNNHHGQPHRAELDGVVVGIELALRNALPESISSDMRSTSRLRAAMAAAAAAGWTAQTIAETARRRSWAGARPGAVIAWISELGPPPAPPQQAPICIVCADSDAGPGWVGDPDRPTPCTCRKSRQQQGVPA